MALYYYLLFLFLLSKYADFLLWLSELSVSTNRKSIEKLANPVHIYIVIGKQTVLIVLADGQHKLLPYNTADPSQSC